jgi:hypothetical protein
MWVYRLLFVLNIIVTDSSSLNFIGNVLVLEPWLLQMEQNYSGAVNFSLQFEETCFHIWMMMVMSCWTDLPKLEGISNPFLR